MFDAYEMCFEVDNFSALRYFFPQIRSCCVDDRAILLTVIDVTESHAWYNFPHSDDMDVDSSTLVGLLVSPNCRYDFVKIDLAGCLRISDC